MPTTRTRAAREEIETNREYAESLQRLFAILRAADVPSGIVHVRISTFTTVWNYDGHRPFRSLAPSEWRQLYRDLHSGVIEGGPSAGAMPPLEELDRLAERYHAEDVTPLALARIDFHQPNPSFVLGEMLRAAQDRRAIVIPADIGTRLQQRSAFLACALLPQEFDEFIPLPRVHFGLTVRYMLDESLYVTNAGDRQPAIQIDFGDGRGLRPWRFGTLEPVSYGSAGEKVLRLQADYGDRMLQAEFTIAVKDTRGIPLPDRVWDLEGIKPYKESIGAGVGYVLFGSDNGIKHGSLQKPIIIADGFPGHNYWYIYALLDTQGFLTAALRGGYDCILLSYDDGSDYIQRNAFIAVACIQQAISEAPPGQQLIVGGGSMGGIVTRYALAYMEQNDLPHQTRLYFSFDSPHLGANFPMSIQFLVKTLAETYDKDEAKPEWERLQSPAANQLIINNNQEKTSLYDEFQVELEALGFPALPTKIAIANGCGDGQLVIPNHAQTIEWYQFALVSIKAWAPAGDPLLSAAVGSIYLADDPGHVYLQMTDCANLDGVPGGQMPYNREIAQKLQDSPHPCVTSKVEHWYGDCCFIPTVSALDISYALDNPLQPVPATGANTPFDDYLLSSVNTPHVQITPEICLFLLGQLGVVKFGGPIAALYYSVTGLHVFGVNTDSEIIHLWRSSSGFQVEWFGQTSEGGGLALAPGSLTAQVGGPNLIDMLAISNEGHLLHIAYTSAGWGFWQDQGTTDLGGGLTGAVLSATAIVGGNGIQIFAITYFGHLLHRIYQRTGWNEWEDLGTTQQGGGLVGSSLAATAGMNPIDLLAISADGSLLQNTWDGSQWSDWQLQGSTDLGGGLVGSAVCAVAGSNWINAYALSVDGLLLGQGGTENGWSGWSAVTPDTPTRKLAGPIAGAVNGAEIDIIAVTDHGGAEMQIWDGSSWSNWARIA
jgi:hypothetical protein